MYSSALEILHAVIPGHHAKLNVNSLVQNSDRDVKLLRTKLLASRLSRHPVWMPTS